MQEIPFGLIVGVGAFWLVGMLIIACTGCESPISFER